MIHSPPVAHLLQKPQRLRGLSCRQRIITLQNLQGPPAGTVVPGNGRTLWNPACISRSCSLVKLSRSSCHRVHYLATPGWRQDKTLVERHNVPNLEPRQGEHFLHPTGRAAAVVLQDRGSIIGSRYTTIYFLNVSCGHGVITWVRSCWTRAPSCQRVCTQRWKQLISAEIQYYNDQSFTESVCIMTHVCFLSKIRMWVDDTLSEEKTRLRFEGGDGGHCSTVNASKVFDGFITWKQNCAFWLVEKEYVNNIFPRFYAICSDVCGFGVILFGSYSMSGNVFSVN